MKNNVEVIKTVVLWMLFISSIALFVIRYNLIGYGSSTDYAAMIGRQFSLSKDNIMPSHIIVKFNQYDMTNIIHDKQLYYTEASKMLYNILLKSKDIKKINETEFKSAKKTENMLLIYEDIPSTYIDSMLDIKKSIISDIGYINEILIPNNSKNIFIKTKDDFYKINFNNSISLSTLSNLSNKIYQKYYPKFENINTNENLILPLNINVQLGNIKTKNILDNIKAEDIAKNILKDRFDFTSSIIQKNGDYFYSYNNGQEILKITSDGFIEYKNETMENMLSDLNKSTETMFNFLSQLGINKKEIIISSVKKIEKNSAILYRFNIRTMQDSLEVAMQKSILDSYIEVSGNMLIGCKLYLRYPTDIIGEKNAVVDPAKALNIKIEEIKLIMNISDVESIISNIQDINLIYSMNKEDIIVPTWTYKIKDYIFNIDAVTQELINYGMVKN